MQSALARHCFRCFTAIHKTRLFWSPQQLHSSPVPSLRSQLSTTTLSSPALQQVRGSFLRAGPGRELGTRRSRHSSNSQVEASLPTTSTLSPDTSELDPTDQGTGAPPPSKRIPQPYKEIVLLETDFRERFIKGGGNGGQKINKTNSNVELKHHETGIVVQCQATRSLPQNRKLARKILISRLDEYYNGEMSKRGQKAEKIRQRKMRMARKSAKKYHGAGQAVDDQEEDDELDEGDDDLSEEPDVNSESEPQHTLDNKIQFTTLEEELARDNKKPSRRKAARKD